jgi:hypothetical protein
MSVTRRFSRRELIAAAVVGPLSVAISDVFADPTGGKTMQDRSKATIARVWRGRVLRERADEYQAYWLSQLQPLRDRALALDLFREDRAAETEFTSISYWPDEKTMLGFSKSEDPTVPHHLPRDREFLIELPERVQVLKVLRGQ